MTKNTWFGTLYTEGYEFIEDTVLDDGRRKTVKQYNNGLIVTCIANEPSEQAINDAADYLHKLAEEAVENGWTSEKQ